MVHCQYGARRNAGKSRRSCRNARCKRQRKCLGVVCPNARLHSQPANQKSRSRRRKRSKTDAGRRGIYFSLRFDFAGTEKIRRNLYLARQKFIENKRPFAFFVCQSGSRISAVFRRKNWRSEKEIEFSNVWRSDRFESEFGQRELYLRRIFDFRQTLCRRAAGFEKSRRARASRRSRSPNLLDGDSKRATEENRRTENRRSDCRYKRFSPLAS